MIQIVFPNPPIQRRRKPGWWVGLTGFPTKREASIYLADSGRKATAWLMELNELQRILIHAGQCYAADMEIWQLMKWADRKAHYDAHFVMVKRTAKSVDLCEMYPRLDRMARTVLDIAEIVHDCGNQSDKITARIVTERLTKIVTELKAWQAPAREA